jgi:NADH dehydrogenase
LVKDESAAGAIPEIGSHQAAPATATAPRPRVFIIGAGFGGLSAAKALASAPVDVTVIDRRNNHLLQPLLYH